MNKPKPQVIRHEDALKSLADALAAPPKSKLRQTYLDMALWTYYAGLLNHRVFKSRGERRGRPNGTKEIAFLDELLTRMKRGEKPTTAAMAILRNSGIKGKLKGRADHMVRTAKKRF